jgi:hypothetical protein
MTDNDRQQGLWHMDRAIGLLGIGPLVAALVERDEAVAELAQIKVREMWTV